MKMDGGERKIERETEMSSLRGGRKPKSKVINNLRHNLVMF